MEAYRVSLFAGAIGAQRGGEDTGHRLSVNFADLLGICMDKRGDIYTSGYSTGTISVIRGDTVSTLLKDPVNVSPTAICFGEDGVLYLTDQSRHMVHKLVGGKLSKVAGEIGVSGETVGKHCSFRSPAGIAVDKDGSIYVANQMGESVAKVNEDSGAVDLYGGMREPFGVLLDGRGTLYVAEFGGHVKRVDGGTVTTVLESSQPTGLTFDPYGNLLVCEYYTGDILRVSGVGTATKLSFVDDDGKPYRFTNPIDMVSDVTGVYVVEHSRHLITKIDMFAEWTPAIHDRFPEGVRRRIKAFMTIATKSGYRTCQVWRLPKDIALVIAKLIAKSL